MALRSLDPMVQATAALFTQKQQTQEECGFALGNSVLQGGAQSWMAFAILNVASEETLWLLALNKLVLLPSPMVSKSWQNFL